MNYPIGKKVIIRTNRAGVFFGTLSEYDAATRTAEIKDCRRLWCWSGAASLSQLANEGVKKPDNCKFTVVVPVMQVMEVIEIILCTEEAIENIESVWVWKK
jgi:hypothetical protein